MKFRRMRRTVRWTATALCAGIALIAIANVHWVYIELVSASGERWSAEMGFVGGAVDLTWKPYGGGINAYRISNQFRSWDKCVECWSDLAIVPTYWEQQQSFTLATLTIPLWIPFVAFGALTGLLWWIDRTRHAFSSYSRSRFRLILACAGLATTTLILTAGFCSFERLWPGSDRELTLGANRGVYYAISRQIGDSALADMPRTRWSLAVASWLPALLIGVAALYVWRGNLVPNPSLCQNCHYNLTGNTTGVCPECGQPAASTA